MSNPAPAAQQPAIRVTAIPAVDHSSVKIVTEACFTFVAIDELDKPRPVPPEETP